jgi:hypothetical protein
MVLGQLGLTGKALGLTGKELSPAGKAREFPRWQKSPRPSQFLPGTAPKPRSNYLTIMVK